MPPPKKVLFFTSTLGGGGAEMHLLRLLNHLDQSKVDPVLALARPGGSFESQLDPTIQVHHLNPSWIKRSTLSFRLAVRPLRRLIQKQQPDAVMAVMNHAGLALLKAVEGLSPRPKVIINIQNTLGVDNPDRLSRRARRQLLHIQKQYPKADRLLALCDGVAGELKQLLPGCDDKIQVLYNAGYDDSVFEKAGGPLPFPRPEGKALLVSCGRLTEQKGYPVAIEAARLLKEQNIPFEWWVLGEGKDRPKLEQLIRKNQVQDCFKLLGFQINPYPFMKAANCFVLPSLWEGFGLVIVEAMACGTPVVAADCPFGPGEILTEGVSGLLCGPGNFHALADKIENLIHSPELKRKLTENGSREAEQYSSDHAARALEKLLI